MKKSTFGVAAIFVAYCTSLNAQKAFERLEIFPAGKQEAGATRLLGFKEVNTATIIVSAPYATVWPAVKSAARQFDKLGTRPLIAIDEQSGRVQNGKISSDALIGRGGGFNGAWADEFVTEATQLSASTTRLAVTRKLVHKGGLANTNQWAAGTSNGKIERWLISEVLRQIDGGTATEPANSTRKDPDSPAKADTITYVYQEDGKSHLDLNSDGTFLLLQEGKKYQGRYMIAGAELTITLGTQVLKARLAGNSMFDTSGKEWVRKIGDVTAIPTAIAPGNADVEPGFSNSDVVTLVEAKLPDSVILVKIKASSCRFDKSTGGLVKLKQANVSDAVIQEMINCKP